MGELTTTQKFWYVVRNVTKSPLSLTIWLVGGVVSYYVSTMGIPWWLPLVVAGVVEAGVVFRHLNNETYLRNLFIERQERTETMTEQQVETLLERMDFETRQRIRYIIQLNKELVREARAEDVESYARKDLDNISIQMAPLVQQAVKLALKRQQLTKYLHTQDERALKNYCTNLRSRIDGTNDAVTKTQYELALRAREAELQAYQALSQSAGRIDSQLENVEATFASWKAKVIRIKAADMASVQSASQGLYQELENLTTDIDTLDKSVSQALASDNELNAYLKS